MIDKNNFRSQPPGAKKIDTVTFPDPQVYYLDNGVPVYFIRSGTQEILKIDFVFDAGSFFQSQPLVANLTNTCLREGTKNFSSTQIAESIDFYGAYLKTFASRDDAQITLYCLDKYLENVLPIIQDVIFEAVFPDDEIATVIEKSKQKHLVNMRKVSYQSRQTFPSLIFGDKHPYGRYAIASDYDQIESKLLREFYLGFYKHRNFRIIVAGNPVSEPFDILNQFFGSQKVGVTEDNSGQIALKASSSSHHFVQQKDALQSALRVGKALFNKTHPDFLKLQVVNTILGGYFGSRLMKNIREDKGYTYGIGSALVSFKHSGMFLIASEVGKDVTSKALDEVYKEIEILRTEYVGEEELDLVKNYIMGNFLRSADGPFALSELLKAVIDYDMDMGFYQGFIKIIKEMTKEDVLEIAQKYLDPGVMHQLVVGGIDPGSARI